MCASVSVCACMRCVVVHAWMQATTDRGPTCPMRQLRLKQHGPCACPLVFVGHAALWSIQVLVLSWGLVAESSPLMWFSPLPREDPGDWCLAQLKPVGQGALWSIECVQARCAYTRAHIEVLEKGQTAHTMRTPQAHTSACWPRLLDLTQGHNGACWPRLLSTPAGGVCGEGAECWGAHQRHHNARAAHCKREDAGRSPRRFVCCGPQLVGGAGVPCESSKS